MGKRQLGKTNKSFHKWICFLGAWGEHTNHKKKTKNPLSDFQITPGDWAHRLLMVLMWTEYPNPLKYWSQSCQVPGGLGVLEGTVSAESWEFVLPLWLQQLRGFRLLSPKVLNELCWVKALKLRVKYELGNASCTLREAKLYWWTGSDLIPRQPLPGPAPFWT